VTRSRSLVATCAAIAALGAAPASAAPPTPDADRAAAAIVVDGRDGAVMFQKRPDDRRQIASTTKLMTALLTLERLRADDVLVAPPYDAGAAESQIRLRAGERMTVADLLEGLLLESANDAAVTLARGVAGSRRAFVRAMNERASELGLTGTSYTNPIGFDDPENHSTARDLAKLAVRLLRNRRFAHVVDLPEATLESGVRERVVDNRNRLVARHPFVEGVKTGHTLGAGYVLVGAARGPGGGKIVSVVLGTPSEAARDAETLELLRWGVSRFRRVRMLDPHEPLARPEVEYRDERAALVPARAASVTVRAGQRIARRVRAPEELEGPLPAGERVGTVTLVRDGKAVRRVPLVTVRPVPGAGLLRRLFSGAGVPLTLLAAVGILGAAALAARKLRLRVRLVRE
jgi:D-alanyl-D-alanine carboxypeptidase (penicillin-binding protein 5/6)